MNVGDDIDSLPVDNSQLNPSELAIINTYLHPVPEAKPTTETIKAFTPLQQYLFLFILFILLSLPAVDDMLSDKIPSVYSRILAKGAVFTLVYFVAMNK